MGVWKGTIYTADRRRRVVKTLDFPNAAGVFDGAEFLAVKTVVGDIATAMANMSEARLGHAVTFFEEPTNIDGLSATVDVNDTLLNVLYLTSTDASGNRKTWNFPIAAPIEAILIDADTADINDPLFAALSTALEAGQTFGMRVSDGEQIDFTLGADGFKSGRWISKKSS